MDSKKTMLLGLIEPPESSWALEDGYRTRLWFSAAQMIPRSRTWMVRSARSGLGAGGVRRGRGGVPQGALEEDQDY